MAKYRISLNGIEREVEVTSQGDMLSVTGDGLRSDLRLLRREGESFVLEWLQENGERKQIRAAGHVDADRRQLWVNGHTFKYERVRQRSSADVLEGSLSSSIPAVVSQVLVTIEDTVTKGDKLILLESMKMIIPIVAPCNGKVTEIHCEVGQPVQAGVPLLELEEYQL